MTKQKTPLDEKEKDFWLVSHEGDKGFLTKDVREAVKELKKEIDENLEFNRKSWYPTDEPQIAQQRLMIAKFHTDILEKIDKIFGKLAEEDLK